MTERNEKKPKISEIKNQKQAVRALKPKKKSLTRKMINIIIICSVTFVVAVLVVTLCCVFLIKDDVKYQSAFKNVHNFVALACETGGTAIDLAYDSTVENVAFLYKTASDNCKSASSVNAYNRGGLVAVVGNSNNYIDVDSVIMKTQEEYFKCEYRIKKDFPLADMPIVGPIFTSRNGITNSRIYADANDVMAVKQTVNNNNWEDELGVPATDWSVASTVNISKPVFNDKQEGDFTVTEHTVNINTITDCTLEQTVGEQGEKYYTITFSLDLSNDESTQFSRESIIQGTGDKKCKYSSVTFVVTIWENGYFRSMNVVENWEANFVVTKGKFCLTYNWYFSYVPEDCLIQTYPDAVSLVEYHSGLEESGLLFADKNRFAEQLQ